MAAAPSLAPPGDVPQRASLYVGDLDPEVTETDLEVAFLFVGPLLSFRLCRCACTGKSLCYGYVNFFTHYQACEALQSLNHTYLKGKPMRLMWSQRNPCDRKSGIGNLFVKNLHPSIPSALLQNIFSKFGSILSCKVVEENGKSKGFGFVQFQSEDSAMAARTALHDTVIEGKKLHVSKFVKKTERTAPTRCEQPKSINLFVKNVAANITEDTLQNMFSVFGKVYNVVIMKDHDGKSRGFGFVNFESEEDARKAIDALNGSLQGSQTLHVKRAQKKAEIIKISQHEYKDTFKEHKLKLKASNLYVKNLKICIDDNELRELFSPWGNIVSAKVMRHDNGVSKGFGFVCFSGHEEARSALNSLHGKIFRGKRLYVAIAQSRKDRQLQLQKYHGRCQSQSAYLSNCNVVTPPINPRYLNFSSYPQSVPFLHNPISYQNFGVHMGFEYPLAAQSYYQHFSDYVPMGQIHQSFEKLKDQSCQPYSEKHAISSLHDRDLNHGYAGMQNFVSKKRWNRRDEPPRSTAKGLPASSCLAAAKSPNNSKKDTRKLFHPLVENLQPEHAGYMAGMLSKPANSLSLPVDSAVQVLKEANSLKSSDSRKPMPKSAARRCL